MNYRYQQPHERLSDIIRTVLVLDGSKEPDPNSLPLFTNGLPALFSQFHNDQIVSLSLYGRSVPAEKWELANNSAIIAHFFHPYALSTLFNIEAKELLKEPVELDTWEPHRSRVLRTQLLYATTIEKRIEVMDNFLLQQLYEQNKECEIIRYATDAIMCDPAIDILVSIQNKLKLSERTFQRMFKKYVGVSPVQYRRICQFHASFGQVRAKDFDKLTDVAYDNGFADQSHFIRSFREFTKTTPKDYLKSGLNPKKE
jgi:AraC-like DNA-binding protein